MLLRGRCRDCDAAISWRYPAVEALSAGLWISAMLVWPGASGELPDLWLPWAGLPLIALLLLLVLIDLDHLWLPEPLCRWGVVLVLLLLESLSVIAARLLGKPALGLGDGKLAALGGAWLDLGGMQRRCPWRLFREPWPEALLASVAGWALGNRSPSVPSLLWAFGWSS